MTALAGAAEYLCKFDMPQIVPTVERAIGSKPS